MKTTNQTQRTNVGDTIKAEDGCTYVIERCTARTPSWAPTLVEDLVVVKPRGRGVRYVIGHHNVNGEQRLIFVVSLGRCLS